MVKLSMNKSKLLSSSIGENAIVTLCNESISNEPRLASCNEIFVHCSGRATEETNVTCPFAHFSVTKTSIAALCGLYTSNEICPNLEESANTPFCAESVTEFLYDLDVPWTHEIFSEELFFAY